VEQRTQTENDIRATGLRCTVQRVAVLDALRRAGGHQPVTAVTAAVREQLGTVSPQGVYDALDSLSRHGLVQRVEPAGSPALYEAGTVPHPHAVCRRCGAVADVDPAEAGASPTDLRGDHGYAIDGVEVTFWGLCPRCQRTTDETNDETNDEESSP